MSLTRRNIFSAAATPVFCDYQSGKLAEVQTRAWVAWNERALCVAIRCEEPRIADIRATMTERDSGVWGDDNVEVFLKPPTGETYYHFSTNALGTLFDERAHAYTPADAPARMTRMTRILNSLPIRFS